MELCIKGLHDHEALYLVCDQHLPRRRILCPGAGSSRLPWGPCRTKKREKKNKSLKSVVEKFGSIPLKDFFHMAIDFYNDELDK